MPINPNTNFTAGAILTADQQNRFGRGVVGRAIATSPQTITGTVADFTGLTATFTAVANRYYKISFCIPSCTGTAANRLSVTITDSANVVYSNIFMTVATTGFTMNGFTTATFAGGTVTMKLRGLRDAGADNITCYAASDAPMQFLIEDIGPA